jgi:NADPH:quinone reductase-like Zn-dependent oxidoreductase
MAFPTVQLERVPAESAAVRLFEHGGPDKLTYGVYPLPEPGPRDVVVDVHAIGVTGFDLKYRRGLPAHAQLPGRKFFPLPQQLGREAAGIVSWAGPEVRTLSPGDRVVAVTHPEDPYGAETARGLGNLSAGLDIPGHQSPGSYARYLVRDEQLWLPLPSSVDIEQAAVTLWSFSTAHRVLTSRLRTGLGDIVVILGATGAMGIAAIQLARLLGARPVAGTRDPAKEKQLRALGAVDVLDVCDLDAIPAQLRALSEGRGVDQVIDFAGHPQTLFSVTSALRVGGSVCISAGEESANPMPFRAVDMIRLEMNLLGIRGARRGDMLAALDLLNQQRISIPVAHRFPLSQAATAHEVMEAGLHEVGRVVLIPER